MLIGSPLRLVVAGVLMLGAVAPGRAQTESFETLHAGVATVEISPVVLPAIRNGGFIEASSDRVDDPLFARSLVLAQKDVTIAICIVDSCMLPTDVCDAIKQLVNERTDIPIDRILISATHTHTAPSTMSYCLGSRRDDRYTSQVIPQIARSIVIASETMQPATIGWTLVDARELTNCRRWLTRLDRMGTDPFGNQTVRAMMHPGYMNPDYVCPAGPIDPGLSVLSVKNRDSDSPLCIMGNLSMHYFGAGPGFSADYFGLVAEKLETEMVSAYGASADDFVGIMSQGTSGDLHWMDYSQPNRGTSRRDYAEAVAAKILDAVSEIEYSHDLPIDMAEERIILDRRIPSEARLEWARSLNEERGEQPPRNRPEVYAQQAQWIHDNPTTEVVLQAVRIGGLGITAIPNEVYGITGLKLKKQSPFDTTFNLELANGAEGYIPPPAQHKLGGYTTWPARTAGLAENAEPEIVDTLLGLLERVADRPRRQYVDPPSDYSRAIHEAAPIAYWRLGDIAEGTPQDEVGAIESQVDGTLVQYLSGPDGDGFDISPETNRAMYFVDARLSAVLPDVNQEYSVSMWFWNGMPAELAPESVCLFLAESDGTTHKVSIAGQNAPSQTGRLVLAVGEEVAVGESILATKAWHHLTIVSTADGVAVYLDGRVEPEIRMSELAHRDSLRDSTDALNLTFGGEPESNHSFDGKLDEIALFDRALSAAEIEELFQLAAVPRPELPVTSEGYARKPTDDESWQRYAEAIQLSEPLAFWRLHDDSTQTATDLIDQQSAQFEGDATGLPPTSTVSNFRGGRLYATIANIGDSYSVEFWIRNDVAVRERPVTGYMFCRGTDEALGAPGDSLGIGGTHSWTGRLFIYNGNERGEAISGTTLLRPGRWNHVVFVRDGETVRAYLNGNVEPEFEGQLPITYPSSESQFFIGGRNDNFANFNGMIEEVALYDRVLAPNEIHAHFSAAGAQRLPDEPQEEEAQPQSTSPEQSLDLIHVPVGYRVELVASEPLIRDPVAIDWGPDGKLWVVEMADYPLGLDGQGEAGGRIRYLEDLDGDGIYDSSTLFAQGLSFPTGILAWGQGVLVTAAPEIVYLEDSDGDGEADIRTRLYSGFLEGNQQLRVNGLRWGFDHWIYCASGSHHAGYGSDSRITSHLTNTEHQIGSRDFRIRPDTGEIDPQSGPSQYGRNRDDWGNWFGVQNSLPLWHYVLADQDIRRNPHFAPPDPRHQVVTPPNPRVYPASLMQKRFHSFEQSGRFTSACSAMIYRDELLFDRDERQHAFTCEPFHNLVQHNVITNEGVSFSFHRPEAEGEFDFFASEDRWCRPVMVRTGPDGALWVVDMYRYMIEHPEWLPENGRQELRPYYRHGAEQGRIYRIVPEDFEPVVLARPIDMTTEQLIRALESSNGWMRDMAQRQLVIRRDPSVPELLRQLYLDTSLPLAHLHILTTLDALDALPSELVGRALVHAHPGVRKQAVRLAAQFEFDLIPVAELLRDPDKQVVMQLATTLGVYDDPRAAVALASIAIEYQDDRYLVAAVMSSLHDGNVSDVFSHAVNLMEHGDGNTESGEGFEVLLDALLGQTIAMGSHETITSVVLFAARLGNGEAEPHHNRLLSKVLREVARRGVSLQELLADDADLLTHRIEMARIEIGNDDADVDRRVSALGMLLLLPSNRQSDLNLMRSLLNARTPILLQEAIVDRCFDSDDPAIVELMTESWSAHSPPLRERIVGLLSSRRHWALALLELLEDGTLSVSEFGLAQRERLLQISDDSTRRRWEVLFASTSNQSREEVIRHYRDTFQLDANEARGAELFVEHCSKCHRFQDVGTAVGPDLAALTNKTDEHLLSALFDPNSAVEAKYVSYVATDIDGRVYTGIITTETATSITMVSNEGESRSLLRAEIDELHSTGMSLMPSGMEDELSRQDVADLLHYIKQ